MNPALDSLKTRRSLRALGHLLGLLATAGLLRLQGGRLLDLLWALAGLAGFEVVAWALDGRTRRLRRLAPAAFPIQRLGEADRDFLQDALGRMPLRAGWKSALAWTAAAGLLNWRGLPWRDALAAGLPVSAWTAFLGGLAAFRRVAPFFYFKDCWACGHAAWHPNLKRRFLSLCLAPLSPLALHGALAPQTDAWSWAWVLMLAAGLAWAAAATFHDTEARPLEDLRAALERFGRGDFQARLDVTSGGEVGRAIEQHNRTVRELERRFWALERFGRLVSAESGAMMFESGIKLDGEAREVAVLCARLLDSAPLKAFNRFCQVVQDCAEAQGGGLDEVGEGLLVALFGAPLPMPDSSQAVLRAAWEAWRRLQILSVQLRMQEGLSISFGLAAACGCAELGLAGPAGLRRYTALGGPAAEARRLSLSSGIWLGESLRAALPAGFRADEQGRLVEGPEPPPPSTEALGFAPGFRL